MYWKIFLQPDQVSAYLLRSQRFRACRLWLQYFATGNRPFYNRQPAILQPAILQPAILQPAYQISARQPVFIPPVVYFEDAFVRTRHVMKWRFLATKYLFAVGRGCIISNTTESSMELGFESLSNLIRGKVLHASWFVVWLKAGSLCAFTRVYLYNRQKYLAPGSEIMTLFMHITFPSGRWLPSCLSILFYIWSMWKHRDVSRVFEYVRYNFMYRMTAQNEVYSDWCRCRQWCM